MLPDILDVVADLPEPGEDEDVRILTKGDTYRLERIVSYGHTSPENFWYEQQEDEWVMVLAGAGQIQIFGETEPRTLRTGESLFLPAGVRHRVVYTAPDQATVWLALFSQPGAQVSSATEAV